MSNVLTKLTYQERSNTSTSAVTFTHTGNLLLFVRMLHNCRITHIYIGVEAIQSLGSEHVNLTTGHTSSDKQLIQATLLSMHT